jgi:tetratricopeptide (TPR) repeat protein
VLPVLLLGLLFGAESCQTGKALFGSKSYAAAQENLWRCVEAGTSDREYGYLLSLTFRELKNYTAGFERVVSLPDSVDKLYIHAYLQFRVGNARESCSTLEAAYRRDPDDWRVYQLYGLNYVVLDIKEGAEVSFTNAIRLNPNNAELWYLLARFYYTDNRPQQSIAAATEALKLVPDYPEVYSNIALCYEALADDTRAEKNFQRAIELNRKLERRDEWPLLNYAAYLIKQGRPQPALPVVTEGLTVNNKSARGHYLMGRALSKVGRIADARKHLETSISLDDKDASAYFELGMLLQRVGDREGSRTNLARFESLKKGSRK